MEEGEEFPQFPYLLTSTVSLMVRQWAICSIQAYLTIFKVMIQQSIPKSFKALRKPTDNQWWSLVRELVEWMTKKGQNQKALKEHTISEFVNTMENGHKF